VSGVALFSASAFAQSYGKNPNDGGLAPEPPASAPATVKATTAKGTVASQQPAYYGKNINDGGLPPEPTPAAKSTARSQPATPKPAAPTQVGRNVNDGGSVTVQQ